MVRKANKNLALVKNFKERAGKIVKIDEIIFFGSRAKGNFNSESDFDLLVVSDDFEEQPFYKRCAKLYPLWSENYPLELICFTEKELKEKQKNQYGIVAEAKRTGITI